MATGGTIPSNRTQSVTFYNTTSVIERDKNIYYVPRFSKVTTASAGDTVREAYLKGFNVVCPPSSAYAEIALTGWSPQDRTLTVRGNIDDFRLVTEEGKCLNYFIIHRTITKGEGQQATSRQYYYGFFITGVKQSGGSSVTITCEPDDFTNVFYLHNSHTLTALEISGDYEPFNEKMKNCYVNRQHYNRVKWSTEHLTISSSVATAEITSSFTMNFTVTMEGDLPFDTTTILPKYRFSTGAGGATLTVLYVSERTVIIAGTGSGNGTIEVWCTATATNTFLESDNLKVFLNQEESFKFKYQYKDKKLPFAFNEVFTQSELEDIEEEDNFWSLSQELKNKIAKACMQYLVIEMKSLEKVCESITVVDGGAQQYLSYWAGNEIEGFDRSGPVLSVPFFNIPEIFKKYESSLNKNLTFQFINDTTYLSTKGISLTSATDAYHLINKNALADFIYSVYVVNDIGIKGDIYITRGGVQEIIYTIVDIYNTENVALRAINDNDPEQMAHPGIIRYYSSNGFLYYGEQGYIIKCLQVSSYQRNFALSLSEDYSNLKNRYFDPVLEAEPYSFYSMSYLSYEYPFNKNRYYEQGEIVFNYYISVNGSVKMSFVPTYTVEGKEFVYFTEGLVFTLTSFLPMVSDSYDSYYYQNKAQMKNQYAVNAVSGTIDMAQHFLISGPNAVGYSAGKGGMSGGGAGAGFNAILETGNQYMQMLDEAVDYAQGQQVTYMNQKARLADMGARPDAVKQIGSDVFSDLITRENRLYFNHYTIDELSYNSVAKMLERLGYLVNLYDSIHAVDRVGWNFVRLNSFDFYDSGIMTVQEQSIRTIFRNGVTMLHDKTYLTTGHNFETILEGGD